MIDKARLESFKEKSALKKERLAMRLKPEEGPWLLAALRFLVHHLSEESLTLNQSRRLSEILKPFSNPPKRLKRILRTARRLLKLHVDTQRSIPGLCSAETWLRMEKGWIRHLFNSTGLDLRDPFELQAFRRLNMHMLVDTAMKFYYAAHPIVERVKASLTGTMVTSSRAYQSRPDTPFVPLEINPDPDRPRPVSEMERLINQMGRPSASGGRLTREEFARLPDESPPDFNVDPDQEPDTPTSQFWQEQLNRMNRQMRRR